MSKQQQQSVSHSARVCGNFISSAAHLRSFPSPLLLLHLHLISPLGPLVVGRPIHASIDFLVYVSVPVVSQGDFSTGRLSVEVYRSAATPSPFAKRNTLNGVTNDEQLSIFTKE